MRVDSLGNRRSRLHYIGPYRSAGSSPSLVGLPRDGTLWAHSINYYPYVPNFYGGLSETQVVRFDSVQRIVWQRRYPGPTPNINSNGVVSMAQLRDGSYVLIGTKGRAFSPPSGSAPFVVGSGWQQRLKASGDTITLPEYFGKIEELYQPAQVKPTPDGGYVVVGQVFPNKYVPDFNCCATGLGWLAKFDSLGTLRWEQRLEGVNTALNNPFDPNTYKSGANLTNVEVLANGHYLVSGTRGRLAADRANTSYLAEYAPAGTGATAVWERYLTSGLDQRMARLAPSGPLVLAGQQGIVYPLIPNAGGITRFDNVAPSADVGYCQHPPRPVAAFQANAAQTTLTFSEASLAGPRYAQLVRWRWHLGDGTFYEGQVPPPHTYATVPAPGTPVTLTVTNNLDCSATLTLYPWGPPAAPQQVGLYPNPAQGSATLALPATLLVPGTSLTLLDVLGRPVRRWPVDAIPAAAAGTVTRPLDLGGLAGAVYLLQVPTTEGLVTKRLTVQP
ncbi:MAG: PKD domain-containing protein [Janthinobacterium lividum]